MTKNRLLSLLLPIALAACGEPLIVPPPADAAVDAVAADAAAADAVAVDAVTDATCIPAGHQCQIGATPCCAHLSCAAPAITPDGFPPAPLGSCY